MDTKNLLKKVGIGLIIIIVVIFAFLGSIIFDVASYTATSSQTLQPNGTNIGNAMVVYDPGLSGAASGTASTIASKLQAKGYTVDLVGIKNSKATNTSNYNIVVVGGPVYAGKVASSVQEYLKNLNPAPGTKVGVFVTGQDPDTANNYTLLLKEAAPLPENSNITIKAAVKVTKDDNDKIIAFVNTITQ
jgi:flavodoxin